MTAARSSTAWSSAASSRRVASQRRQRELANGLGVRALRWCDSTGLRVGLGGLRVQPGERVEGERADPADCVAPVGQPPEPAQALDVQIGE